VNRHVLDDPDGRYGERDRQDDTDDHPEHADLAIPPGGVSAGKGQQNCHYGRDHFLASF